MTDTPAPDEPRGVSRRVAYNACIAVLLDRARELETRAERTARRRGLAAGLNSQERQVGRSREAEHLRDAADHCRRLAALASGGTVDAAALGYLVAVCGGESSAAAELYQEMAALGRPLPEGAHARLGTLCGLVIG